MSPFDCCFHLPSNYSLDNCFLRDSSFLVEQNSDSRKISFLKKIYKQSLAYDNMGLN